MKITVHLDMEEGDFIGILQVAGMKGITAEELIRQSIREYINREVQSFRTEAGRSESGQNQAAEGNAKGNES